MQADIKAFVGQEMQHSMAHERFNAAAAENMTAGFAQSLFAPGEAEKILREDVRELYLWHAAEEMEHRDLAYNLYQQVGGDYATRMAGMVFAYVIIAAYVW
jgi:hypothetical protein